MEASVLQRLDELRGERALGMRRLEELAREYDGLRETVVRIGGAIQVLEELLRDADDGGDAAGDGATGLDQLAAASGAVAADVATG